MSYTHTEQVADHESAKLLLHARDHFALNIVHESGMKSVCTFLQQSHSLLCYIG